MNEAEKKRRFHEIVLEHSDILHRIARRQLSLNGGTYGLGQSRGSGAGDLDPCLDQTRRSAGGPQCWRLAGEDLAVRPEKYGAAGPAVAQAALAGAERLRP